MRANLDFFRAHPWIDQAVFKSLMLGAALLACRATGVSLLDAGVCGPSVAVRWRRLLVGTVSLATAWTYAGYRLELPADSRLEALSLQEKLVWAGIYSSTIEEICYRGWFQGALARAVSAWPTTGGSSTAVTISAVVFALVHYFLILRGVDPVAVHAIVLISFVVGYIAAIQRRSTGSVIPAIAVHVTFNVTTSLVSHGISRLLLWLYPDLV
jgi:membrane protease YdiL (CAAX protease family)